MFFLFWANDKKCIETYDLTKLDEFCELQQSLFSFNRIEVWLQGILLLVVDNFVLLIHGNLIISI